MTKIITVRIKDGNVTIATEGFPGATCQDATAALERALGETVSDVPTAEMLDDPDAKIEVGH